MPTALLYFPLAAVLLTKNRPGLLRRTYNIAHQTSKHPQSIGIWTEGGGPILTLQMPPRLYPCYRGNLLDISMY